MKSTRTRFAKKLKSIRAVDYLKQDRVLRVLSAADGLVEFLPKITNPITQITNGSIRKVPQKLEEETVDVSNLLEDEEEDSDEEEASGSFVDEKENIGPRVNQNCHDLGNNCRETKPEVSSRPDTCTGRTSFGSEFRRPDLNSNSLFDPKLLEAFEQAVKCYMRISQSSREARTEEEDVGKDENALGGTSESEREATAEEGDGEKDDNTLSDPLLGFEQRCPPGGEDSVVFYTTTLRGIRKTFDDCNKIRFLLDSFRVQYYERDVSMHREYKEELWRTMEGKATLPVLFVKGKFVGGAHRVLSLHEQGKLRVLFDGVPVSRPECCSDCEGVRFLMCNSCRGSHKVVSNDGLRSDCLVCNENGLIVCPNCCL